MTHTPTILSAVVSTLLLSCSSYSPDASSRSVATTSEAMERPIEVSVFVSAQADLGTLADLFGVIGGPTSQTNQQGTLDTCDVTELLQEYGITQIRHNDMGNDRGDIEGILNCSGTPYTACRNSHSGDARQYPCWEGCDNDRFGAFLFFNHTDELYDSMVYPSSGPGFEPMLRIGGSMESIVSIAGKPTPGIDFKGPQNADEYASWHGAALALAQRYLPGGGHAYPPSTIKYVDIITETNSRTAAAGEYFYDNGAWKNRAFPRFWVDAYNSIKPSAGTAKVGGPGFRGQFATSLASMTTCPTYASLPLPVREAVDFMQHLHNQGVAPDWLGWHAFTNNPTEVLAAARNFLDFKYCTRMFAQPGCSWCTWNGDFTGTEVLADAFSFGIHGGTSWTGVTCIKDILYDPTNPAVHPDTCNEVFVYARGAALLTANWIALQTSQQVRRAYVYRGSPFSATDDDSYAMTGCTSTTSPIQKGSGAGIRLWSKMHNDGYRQLYSVSGPVNNADKGLWVLAAKRASTNERAVLVSNTSSSPYTYDLNFGTFPRTQCGHRSVSVYEIKNTGTTTAPQTTDGKAPTAFSCTPTVSKLEIGPYQTQLVVLTP